MTALQRCCSNGTVRQQIWKVVVLSLVETYPDLIFLMYDFFIWIFIDYIKRLHRLKEKLAWTIKILFSPKNPFWIPTVEKCERECDAGENRRYSQNREHHRRDEHHDQLQLLEGLPRFENGRFKTDHYFCTRCVTSLLSICSSCEIFYTFQSRVLLKSTTCVKILHYRIMYKVWSISLERSLSLIGIVIAIILSYNSLTKHKHCILFSKCKSEIPVFSVWQPGCRAQISRSPFCRRSPSILCCWYSFSRRWSSPAASESLPLFTIYRKFSNFIGHCLKSSIYMIWIGFLWQ